MINENNRHEQLIKAWSFNYENFHRWIGFFFLTTGAIFLAYYSEDVEIRIKNGKMFLNVLGLITSNLFYWSSKGFYYWETNWIMLVQNCEKNFSPSERVYGCFANKTANNDYLSITKGANISSSKIAIVLCFVIAVAWMFLLLQSVFSRYFNMTANYYHFFYVCLSIFLIKIFGLIPKTFLSSNLKNNVDLKLK